MSSQIVGHWDLFLVKVVPLVITVWGSKSLVRDPTSLCAFFALGLTLGECDCNPLSERISCSYVQRLQYLARVRAALLGKWQKWNMLLACIGKGQRGSTSAMWVTEKQPEELRSPFSVQQRDLQRGCAVQAAGCKLQGQTKGLPCTRTFPSTYQGQTSMQKTIPSTSPHQRWPWEDLPRMWLHLPQFQPSEGLC